MLSRSCFEWAFLHASATDLRDTHCRLSLINIFPVSHRDPVRSIRIILHRLSSSQDAGVLEGSLTLLYRIVQRLRENKVNLSEVKQALFSEIPTIRDICLSSTLDYNFQGSHSGF